MSLDILSKILSKKEEEVHESKKKIPESQLRKIAEKARNRRPFFERLKNAGKDRVNIIAEIKRGSPSKGPIRVDLDPPELAKAYERGGAAAISILTDRTFFFGGPGDLRQARAAVNLPLLRKDFIVSSYQIYETLAWEADAVLLIVRAMSREMLKELLALCHDVGLDALVEVHSELELEAATWAGAKLIGINNRDLTSFKTDIQTSKRLAKYLEPDQVPVSESGIKRRKEIEELVESGIYNFLIGESLLRAENPERFLLSLLGH